MDSGLEDSGDMGKHDHSVGDGYGHLPRLRPAHGLGK